MDQGHSLPGDYEYIKNKQNKNKNNFNYVNFCFYCKYVGRRRAEAELLPRMQLSRVRSYSRVDLCQIILVRNLDSY